jgi:type VI protein secretion system component Hcp
MILISITKWQHKIMIRSFESIQGDHGSIAQKLNEISELCININVINATPVMMQENFTNKQTPGMLCLIEFQFASEQDKNKFELAMRPKKLMSVNE